MHARWLLKKVEPLSPQLYPLVINGIWYFILSGHYLLASAITAGIDVQLNWNNSLEVYVFVYIMVDKKQHNLKALDYL